jgi:hypothetical protein
MTPKTDVERRCLLAYRRWCEQSGAIYQEPSDIQRQGDLLILSNVRGELARFRVCEGRIRRISDPKGPLKKWHVNVVSNGRRKTYLHREATVVVEAETQREAMDLVDHLLRTDQITPNWKEEPPCENNAPEDEEDWEEDEALDAEEESELLNNPLYGPRWAARSGVPKRS